MRRTLTVFALFLVLAPVPIGCAGTLPVNAPAKSDPAATQTEGIQKDSELMPVSGEGCGSELSLKSTRYDTPTSIRFKNATKHDVTYYWINYEGKRDQKRTIKPGDAEDRTTFVSHPFVVVDARDACTAVYMPLEKPGLVVITDDRNHQR